MAIGEFTAPQTEESNPEFAALPSYLQAADNHNIGNSNLSLLDPSSWGEAAGNIAKFAAGSLLSGVNSFYNTGVAVGNFFGGEFETSDTSNFIGNLDGDLGQYYDENKQSVDLAGFILTSLAPGLGGIKVLQAGQKALQVGAKSGMIGENLAAATNLLAPSTDLYVARAANELAQSSAIFSTINSNVIKALGAGVGQAALESAAFEVAVTATMFKSPILEDMDAADLTANMLVGTALGGAIGGAFNAAGVYGKIKRTLTKVDSELKPVTAITELPASFNASDKLIAGAYDLERVQSAQIVSDTLQPATISRARENTANSLRNDMRSNIQTLSAGDTELANLFADGIHGLPASKIEASLNDATEIARISGKLKSEKALEKAAAKSTALKVADDLGVATPAQKLGYVRLLGEERGYTTFDGAPKVVNIADNVASEGEVLATVRGYKFKENKLWDATKTSDHLEAEARYIWAQTAKITDGMTIGNKDIPLLERTLEVLSSKISPEAQALENGKFLVNISTPTGNDAITNVGDLYKYLKVTKEEVAGELLAAKRAGSGTHIDEIVKITNLKKSLLEGAQSSDEYADYFARQKFKDDYTKELIAKNLWSPAKGLYPVELKPSWLKVGYNANAHSAVDGMVTEGMINIQSKYKLYQQGVDNAVNSIIGDSELAKQIITLSDRDILNANRYGSQSGVFSFNNGGYDSLSSKVQFLGSATARLERKFMDSTLDALNPVGLQLLAKPAAAIEFAVVNQKISGTAERYVLRGDTLVPKSLAQFQAKIAAGEKGLLPPKLETGAAAEIKITNPETLEAVRQHIATNGRRVNANKSLRAAQGLEDGLDGSVMYPIRKNPQDYPHFAFVVDNKLTGTGHVSMIHAATPGALEQLIGKVPSDLKVITKSQSEEFHKAIGNYDYQRTLHDNYIDSSLRRSGIDSDYYVQTDPQKIVSTWIDDQTRRDRTLAKEVVRAKNEKQFAELERMGEQYTGIEASKYATSLAKIQDTVKNPYANYIKTALNVSSIAEHPLLTGFNNVMDKAFSTVSRAVGETFDSIKSPADLELVNKALEEYGAKSGYYDAATNLLANHTAPRGELTKFIRGANAIITTLTLRTDPLNALNNAIGANVLLGAETANIVKAIKSGNSEIAGRLTQLTSIKIPGTSDLISSPMKLIGKAYKEFVTGDITELKAFYKSNGWSADLIEQHRGMLEDLTLRGGESTTQLSTKMSAAFEKAKSLSGAAEKITGNKLAEEMNRFVAASVMKNFTDAGLEAGIISSADASAMINTFVNRTQGNILASQRPLIFQGPVGAAVGLFQTYQFNLMQQLFRHVSEGSAKDAGMLLGLQGTIYGLNGLPAFNFINTHIVGNASGNQQHRDLYDATYGLAGKDAGDWLMYGAASNLIKTNLYSRGDINPRQVSIIPINPVDIPAVNSIGRIATNLKDIAGKIGNGAPVWETLLQGIEHNGFSRPLAGLAQTAQAFGQGGVVYSTTGTGEILGSNDLFSLATLSRLTGGKPLDEAITNDRFFNIKSYAAKDKERMDTLRESVKASVISGNTPDADELAKFAEGYAKLGGKTKNFNKFMMGQYKNANTPAAERLALKLSNPLAQNMQAVMQGRDVTTETLNTEGE